MYIFTSLLMCHPTLRHPGVSISLHVFACLTSVSRRPTTPHLQLWIIIIYITPLPLFSSKRDLDLAPKYLALQNTPLNLSLNVVCTCRKLFPALYGVREGTVLSFLLSLSSLSVFLSTPIPASANYIVTRNGPPPSFFFFLLRLTYFSHSPCPVGYKKSHPLPSTNFRSWSSLVTTFGLFVLGRRIPS